MGDKIFIFLYIFVISSIKLYENNKKYKWDPYGLYVSYNILETVKYKFQVWYIVFYLSGNNYWTATCTYIDLI